jgi:hypothetical protein
MGSMKKSANGGRVLLLIVVALLISIAVLGASMRLLPAPPLYPTPTYPKGIDFPDDRPVPHR